MIEKIKSALLFLLVGLSLFLTYQLWYGQKPAQLIADDVFERIIVEQPRPLEEVITPERIAANAENGYYIFRQGDPYFASIWEALSQALQEATGSLLAEDEAPGEILDELLVFYFKPELPIGEELPWLTGTAETTIGSIKLFSSEENIWMQLLDQQTDPVFNLQLLPEAAEKITSLVANAGENNLIGHELLTGDLVLEILGENLDIDGSIYVPTESVNMDKLVVNAETIDRDLVLKTFFVDYNLARVIEEKDGGLIYTDGDRGLRLSKTGFEYSAPRLEEGQATLSYADAMHNCSSVISYHGGWPGTLRLENLHLDGRGRTAYYTAEWRAYYRGFPLFAGQETKAFFNDRGLIHFSRNVITSPALSQENGEVVPAAEWSEALRKAIDLYNVSGAAIENGIAAEELTVEALDLGYAVLGSEAAYNGRPIWFIQVNGEKVFLTAEDLEPIDEEDLV